MDSRNRFNIAGGLVLTLLGVFFLAFQLVPELRAWIEPRAAWPLIIVGVGVVQLLVALVTWTPGMVVGACVLTGIGGLLFWQNATGNWASWSYAWALIPGFSGIGLFLSYAMRGEWRAAFSRGGNLLVTSAILFLVFGSFFGGINLLGAYWPVLLIALGVWLLARAFLRAQ